MYFVHSYHVILSHLSLLFLCFDVLRCLQAVMANLPMEKVYEETE